MQPINVTFKEDHAVYMVDCIEALVEKHGIGAGLGAVALAMVRVCRKQANPVIALNQFTNLVRYVFKDQKANPGAYPRIDGDHP